MLKKTTLNISGLHCAGCKNLIESEIKGLRGVNGIRLDLKNNTVAVEFDKNKIKLSEIISEIEKLNYKINQEEDPSKSKKNLLLLIFFAFLLVLGYLALSFFGGFELLAKLNEERVAYPLLFLIGVLAGFHCVGMCGGLVLAYSANDNRAKDKKPLLPHLEYNGGRIISYTLIGGILGGIGSFFGINPVFTGAILIIAGVLMVLMGLAFLTDYKILKKIKIKTPDFVARFLYGNKKNQKPKGPFIIGLLTGFMPCGPLQAMQLYALARGNAFEGALSMAVYAFGTTIAMLIFGALINKLKAQNIARMLKISGTLIIILGILMANRGLSNFGLNFFKSNNPGSEIITRDQEQNFQEIKMDLTYYGYSPNTLHIKSGVPVRWIINARQISGCTDAIMIESLGIKKDLIPGENIIEFMPPENEKEIKFSCWMRMVWGKFIID